MASGKQNPRAGKARSSVKGRQEIWERELRPFFISMFALQVHQACSFHKSSMMKALKHIILENAHTQLIRLPR